MRNIFVKILEKCLILGTPDIIQALRNFAKEWRAAARKTPNPIDDIAADALCALLGVPDTDD